MRLLALLRPVGLLSASLLLLMPLLAANLLEFKVLLVPLLAANLPELEAQLVPLIQLFRSLLRRNTGWIQWCCLLRCLRQLL